MHISDEVLVKRIKRGDEASFRQLVERYRSRVYSIAYAMTKNQSDADDLSQEIFLKVYRFLPQFKGKSKFYTWLYRLAINTCISAINNRKKKHEEVSLFLSSENKDVLLNTLPEESVVSPMQLLENKELGQKIRLAIDSLSDGLKEIFILREIEDLSYKDLAEIFKCPEGTIKSRLFRAREELRKKLLPYLNYNFKGVET